jgi:hypothetical protein
LFTCGAFAIGSAHKGFSGIGNISLRWPWWWIPAAALAIGILLFLLKRISRQSLPGQFASAFVSSGRKLMDSPGRLATGILCGLSVQLALSAVLAFNLEAVSQEPVPWLRLAWTFPLITVISALPITVAGLGTRESAALVLFGLCGVPETVAVAASLMTAIASLIWTGVGGLLLLKGRGQDSLATLNEPVAEAPSPAPSRLKPS